MHNIAWCTDLHFDSTSVSRIDSFIREVESTNAASVLITGDISNAKRITVDLEYLETKLQRPIYFVLGNHDFYGSYIESTRNEVTALCRRSTYLKYLTSVSLIIIGSTAIIGHDGWYDARAGSYKETTFLMNDWVQIGDFATKNVVDHLRMVANYRRVAEIAMPLADASCVHLTASIKDAVRAKCTNIIIATHVPPFISSHIHRGVVGDVNAHPWYVNHALGMTLRAAKATYRNVNFWVFAGHTHSEYVGVIDGVNVRVGSAEYTMPRVADMITIK